MYSNHIKVHTLQMQFGQLLPYQVETEFYDLKVVYKGIIIFLSLYGVMSENFFLSSPFNDEMSDGEVNQQPIIMRVSYYFNSTFLVN